MSRGGHRLSDGGYFWLAVVVYGLVLFAFLALLVVKGDAWMKYDTGRFYSMADVILKGGTPYVDYKDPKPPLIFFTLAPVLLTGQKLAGGYLLVAICNLASALLIFKTGWRLYGRLPGLLAGLLFAVNLFWIEGVFIMTEPFTILFILASAYVLLFWSRPRRYLAAGILAGIAVGFKQYALLAIPLSLLLLYLKGELKGFAGFLAGLLLTLAVIFGALDLAYGPVALQSALYWSFGVAGEYVTSDYVGGDVSAWRPHGTVDTVANIVYVILPLIPMLAFALACLFRGERRTDVYFFFASCLAYCGLLLIRPYFHYLVLALPFAALLCAGIFRDPREAPARERLKVPAGTCRFDDGNIRFK